MIIFCCPPIRGPNSQNNSYNSSFYVLFHELVHLCVCVNQCLLTSACKTKLFKHQTQPEGQKDQSILPYVCHFLITVLFDLVILIFHVFKYICT